MGKQNKQMKNAHVFDGDLVDLMAPEKDRPALFDKAAQLPSINLNSRQLSDLELLINGGFSPLRGFMTEKEYRSVVENCCLLDGTVWPIPIVLDVPDDVSYEAGTEITLNDIYGTPIAILSVEDVYTPDKEFEAQHVYGTTDSHHPGVRRLMLETNSVYIGGSVVGVTPIERYDFKNLRQTPRELRKVLRERKDDAPVIGFQTRNPMHRAHHALIERAAKNIDGHVLIQPVVGHTKEGDVDYVTRVRTYKVFWDKYAKDFSTLSLLPLAMRMAGPREALWHAIIRKNYGCTHFIVGRDHAGPGKDRSGKDFYTHDEAQKFVKQYEDKIGISIITSEELVYVKEKDAYVPSSEITKKDTVGKISGTEFRKMLLAGDEVPSWFSFPETIQELRKRKSRQMKQGLTIFFTGLSGAGKSTIARIVRTLLLEQQDRDITFLDGDIVRQNLSKGLGFSEEDRKANIERIGFVASEVTKHGGLALCAAIAPYSDSRRVNRDRVSKHGTYVEVFVATPVEVCERRDPKGLYKKARADKIKNFTGISDPYEEPENAEIVLRTDGVEPLENAKTVMTYLESNGLL